MLTGINVLAISGDSVVSRPVEGGGAKKSPSGRGRLVTLLVNTYQAEALHLAVENGSLTMTLRNPLDKEPVHEEGSVLNRDSIGRKGETIEPTIPSDKESPEQLYDSDNPQDPAQAGSNFDPNMPSQQKRMTEKYKNRTRKDREIPVHRGPQVKIEQVEISENESDGTAQKK